MKYTITIALTFALGAGSIYAAPKPAEILVQMTFSGSMIPTTLNLGADTITDDEDLAGNSTLGPFTLHKLRTDATAPQPAAGCSGPTQANIPVVGGAGVFRFQDGSLLTAHITSGALCIDFAVLQGKLTETYQISGGTGRFEGAEGSLSLTATLAPVLADVSGNPAFLTATGEIEGTISPNPHGRK